MQRNFNKLLIFSLVILCFSCYTPSVYIDYDEKVDFNSYPSYNFYAPVTELSEEEEILIMDLIENNLKAKGLKSQVIPKFSIDFLVEFVQAESNFSFGTQYAGNFAGAYSGFDTSSTYLVMTISFADALTSELIWQAVVEKKISPYISDQELEIEYKKFVDLALENYPPKPETEGVEETNNSKENNSSSDASTLEEKQ